MKIVFTLALLALGFTGFAQDPCKDIKKEVTEENTNFVFESPFDADNPPPVRVKRSYSTNPDFEYDNFSVVFSIPCEFSELLGKDKDGNEAEKEEMKIVIEFDDKSKITDDTLKIAHETKSDGSYMRVAYFPVTPKNMKTLTGKKIVKFQLVTASEEVPADVATAVQQYIVCMSTVKGKK